MNSSSYSFDNDISNDPDEKYIKLEVTETLLTRTALINRIENVLSDVIKDIRAGSFPELSNFLPSSTINENKDEESQKKGVSFGAKLSRNKFTLMMIVLSTAHDLLISNSTMNRRALYYKLKNEKTMHLASKQADVDKAVNWVANLLNCSPWNLHLIPTCTSLVAGDVTFNLTDNTIIDCSTLGDALIPHIAFGVKSIRTKAKFVLVVEKDTVFQQLLKRNCTRILNCILITGKGYPDMNARMLVKKLCEEMCLPTYIFVDSDPFGIDIMLVYRYGSSALARENESLAAPNARWLGVFPSELRVLEAKTLPLTKYDSAKLKHLTTKTLPLTEQDTSKLRSIESRLSFSFFVKEKILRELNIMWEGKAEIESVISCFPSDFFVKLYLKCKIEGGDYI